MHDPDPEPKGLERFSMRVIHLATPVSIGKSYCHRAMARDHGEPFGYAKMRAMADVAFGEDIAMVEATQTMARRAIDQDEAVEFNVAADCAAIESRPAVSKMVRAERDPARPY